MLFVSHLLVAAAIRLSVPQTPTAMIEQAAAATKAAREAGTTRLTIDLIVPELDSPQVYEFFSSECKAPMDFIVQPEDLDPWPGGLKQQYPFAVDLARQLLRKVIPGAKVQDQVLDAEDACGLLIAQGETAADDVACLLFPGVDQLKQLEQMDASVGDSRTLIVLNRQFTRPADFGMNKGRAASAFFDRGYETAYALQEFACRGEDVKLLGASNGESCEWKAFCFLDDADTTGSPLFEGEVLAERPAYRDVEKEINRCYPSPRWARKLNEVDEKGLNFRR